MVLGGEIVRIRIFRILELAESTPIHSENSLILKILILTMPDLTGFQNLSGLLRGRATKRC